MAVFLMFYVDSLSIPATSERTFSDLTVQVTNLPEGMLLDNEVPQVDLRLKGYSTTIASTSAKDIRVWVDLKNAGTGTLSLIHIFGIHRGSRPRRRPGLPGC